MLHALHKSLKFLTAPLSGVHFNCFNVSMLLAATSCHAGDGSGLGKAKWQIVAIVAK